MLQSPLPTHQGKESPVEAQEEFAQLQLRFVDQMQWRYELIGLPGAIGQ